MKVTCQSCQAKYTIADEKVRGKVAKIRCKKCGTTIIVDGNDSAAASGAAADSGPVADYTHQGSSDEQWTVLVADGDQRTLSAAQVAELYASGTVGFETLVWKDGFADWQAISQTDALRSVLENGPRPTMTPLEVAASVPSSAPPASVAFDAPASRPAPAAAARAKTAEPAAARRPGRGGSTDLFGAAHEDVMTSASEGAAAHADGGADKLTGARNENSVLFSLSALTGGGPAPSAAVPERDPASNKADLRALMGGGGGGGPAKSKIDDIMNLSGGGVYSPGLLAAPAMAPPPIDMMTAAAAPAEAGSKSKSLMVAIGGGLLVVGAVAVAFTTMSSKADSTDKPSAATSAAAESAPVARVANAANAPAEAPAAEQPGVAREPVRQGESAKAEAPSGETAPAAVAPGSPPPKVEAEKVERKVAATPRADKPAAPAAPAGLPPPPVAAPAPAPAAPAPAAPAAGGSGDFDRAAALSALSAAATASQSCKKPDGPTGSGRIAVTFANNGTATTAAVEGPPFAGTPVGGCVAARFRGVHIPPFGGSPITVRKTFIIN
jgi:predicted Zn finger-like uncharacterized protein